MDSTLPPADALALSPDRRPRRRGLRLVVATTALAVAMTVIGPAPAAHAEVGDLVCAINFQINFTPPLTATNTTADVDGDAGFVDCESPNGNFPDLASATVEASGDATSIGGVPCNLLLTTGGSGKITWNTSQVSHFDWTVNTNPLAGTITLSADITSGPLAGDTIDAVPLAANPNVDCALNGLRNLTSVLSVVTIS